MRIYELFYLLSDSCVTSKRTRKQTIWTNHSSRFGPAAASNIEKILSVTGNRYRQTSVAYQKSTPNCTTPELVLCLVIKGHSIIMPHFFCIFNPLCRTLSHVWMPLEKIMSVSQPPPQKKNPRHIDRFQVPAALSGTVIGLTPIAWKNSTY